MQSGFFNLAYFVVVQDMKLQGEPKEINIPVEGGESCGSRKEAIVKGLLGEGTAGRVGGSRHYVHRHTASQLRECHVKLPEQHIAQAQPGKS